jgi:hypothetical protein
MEVIISERFAQGLKVPPGHTWIPRDCAFAALDRFVYERTLSRPLDQYAGIQPPYAYAEVLNE